MKYKNLIPIIASLLLLAACSNNNPTSNTASSQPATNETGVAEDKSKDLFEKKCATCHGNDGTAGIGNAANLQTSQSDSASVTQQISNGKNAMPSFKSQLSGVEVQRLRNYVFTLRK